MSDSEIVVVDVTAEDVLSLEERIYAYNSAVTGIGDGAWLGVVQRNGEGLLVAGLCGSTWGGCLEIRQFWVEESRRRQGIGARLLSAAEDEARRRGCTQVLLMTFSFQAPAFYVKRGFRVLHTVEDCPPGHRNLLLGKSLGAGVTTTP